MKENPILGIGDWLAKEGRLDDAQTVLGTVQKSKKSTEDDKKAAEKMTKELRAKRRAAIAKMVKQEVVMVDTNTLTANEDIEKMMVIKAEDYMRIRDDIADRGVTVPLVVNEKNEVICGITRLKACKEIGLEQVPVFKGTFDMYTEMLDYAVKDNVMRRQLSLDERVTLINSVLRTKDVTVVGRPPVIEGKTKREADAVTKKVQKALTTAKAKATPKTPEKSTKVIEKEYKWVVGANHSKDEDFPKTVADEVLKQIELLRKDKATIEINIKYQITA